MDNFKDEKSLTYFVKPIKDFVFTSSEQKTNFRGARCYNGTNEKIVVYGPKHENSDPKYDNGLWSLDPGKYTPENNFDCDGVYVPNDIYADRRARPDINGPAAIKYIDYTEWSVSMPRNKTYFFTKSDYGAYKDGEINWHIPNWSSSDIQ